MFQKFSNLFLLTILNIKIGVSFSFPIKESISDLEILKITFFVRNHNIHTFKTYKQKTL